MTPARVLAVCRDEWPALRWRQRYGGTVLDAWVDGRLVVTVDAFWGLVDGPHGRARYRFHDARALRAALRAVRYRLADEA